MNLPFTLTIEVSLDAESRQFITTQLEGFMSLIGDKITALTAANTAATTEVAAVGTKVDSLIAAIAAGPTPADVVALDANAGTIVQNTAALTALGQKIDAALATPTPTPNP